MSDYSETRAKHPDVDWRRIAGLRDVVAHGYFGVDDRLVWDVVQNKVPALLQQVRRALKSTGDEDA